MALFTGLVMFCGVLCNSLGAAEPSFDYENRLTPLANPKRLLADHREFVAPVRELHRFEAPMLVDDPGAELHVRAWRFSYNARGIMEMPNRLQAGATVVIMVPRWGIDDGQGRRGQHRHRSEQRAGVAAPSPGLPIAGEKYEVIDVGRQRGGQHQRHGHNDCEFDGWVVAARHNEPE
jgi:hypothetical protein